MVNPNYESFVMRTLHTQRYPRSLSEAFRDADYGTAIWRCESPHENASSALLFIFSLAFATFLLGLFVAPLLS